MIGRAEMLSPRTEKELAARLEDAKSGDPKATLEARLLLLNLGRFAGPAFKRAFAKGAFKPEEAQKLTALLASLHRTE